MSNHSYVYSARVPRRKNYCCAAQHFKLLGLGLGLLLSACNGDSQDDGAPPSEPAWDAGEPADSGLTLPDSRPLDSSEGGLTFKNSPRVGNCPVFSDQYYFNQRVDDPTKYPTLPNSDRMLKNIGMISSIGIPTSPMLTTVRPPPRSVGANQALIPLTCDPNISWCRTSTLIGKGALMVPYPQDLFIVPGADHHAFLFQETASGPAAGLPSPVPLAPPGGGDNCFLYETWWTGRSVNGSVQSSPPVTTYSPGSNVTGFTAGGFSVYDLKRDVSYLPPGTAGSSASNLPVAAGQVRYDEAIKDDIRHAIATAFALVRYSYVSPASNGQIPLNCATSPTNQNPSGLDAYNKIKATYPCDFWNENLPGMGQRFRIKADFDERPYAKYPITLAWIHAGKRYGFVTTDGTPGAFLTSADTDPRWSAHVFPDIAQIKTIPLSAFEAIDSGPMVDIVNAMTQRTANFPKSSVYD